MKLKINYALFGLFCLLINSCREAEELNYSETVPDKSVILKTTSKENDSVTIHKDPPIKGTHWKTK